MKKSDISFDEFREFLKVLGFREISEDKPRLRFDHPAGPVLLFRLYKATEKVNARDIVVVRRQLEDQGVIAATDFDRLLQKTPA